MDKRKTELVVIGAGPGGYAAAFYAAARGVDVLLIEEADVLGGICLNHGCIPSKALLQATDAIHQAHASSERGIVFDPPRIDREKLVAWKNGIVKQLNSGIESIAKAREVEVLHGRGYFDSKKRLRVETLDGQVYVEFNYAIIATGSRAMLPDSMDIGHPAVMTSREALRVDFIPERLLVVGGGYIGLELGTVYARLGSKITLVEAESSLMPGTDPDLVGPVADACAEAFERIILNASVDQMETSGDEIKATLKDEDGGEKELFFDQVLVAVGRQPNTENLGLENAEIKTDSSGFVECGLSGRSSNSHVYAIGDVRQGEMLAHKATWEAKVAVDAILGEATPESPPAVPAVVFTDPEMAWVGLSEEEAKERDIEVVTSVFPWKASGRALTLGNADGVTKLVIEKETERILGAAIVGRGAAELIAEASVAVEMAATVRDLAETIHAHPTVSETVTECAEAYFGTAIHWA